MYTMAQAKRDFEIGYLTTWRIERQPMNDGNLWRVHLGSGMGAGFLVDVRTKEPRVFKTLDAAANAVEEIGIKIVALFQG